MKRIAKVEQVMKEVSKALIMEPTSNHWLTDSRVAHHVGKSKDGFLAFKEPARDYFWEITYKVMYWVLRVTQYVMTSLIL